VYHIRGEVEVLAQVLDALVGEVPVVVPPRELALDQLLGREGLHELDHLPRGKERKGAGGVSGGGDHRSKSFGLRVGVGVQEYPGEWAQQEAGWGAPQEKLRTRHTGDPTYGMTSGVAHARLPHQPLRVSLTVSRVGGARAGDIFSS